VSADRCDLLCLDLPKAEAVRAGLPDVDQLTAVAQQVRAVSDPTRLQIALALGAGEELCVCDLAWICGRAENLVSHHVRVLRAWPVRAATARWSSTPSPPPASNCWTRR
jgi:ArsR family transcriptional regulator, lead/cadmium/zinc/bismuth-responsive transcriptional repressor